VEVALVSPDEVGPAGWSVCLPVNLPLHHKVQKFSSGISSPGCSLKRAIKRLCVCVCVYLIITKVWLLKNNNQSFKHLIQYSINRRKQ